jgi:hypothetical protein
MMFTEELLKTAFWVYNSDATSPPHPSKLNVACFGLYEPDLEVSRQSTRTVTACLPLRVLAAQSRILNSCQQSAHTSRNANCGFLYSEHTLHVYSLVKNFGFRIAGIIRILFGSEISLALAHRRERAG